MSEPVEITFDCLPLQLVSRFDAPLDASPEYEAFCKQVQEAVHKHGQHNAYYLHRGRCIFRLTNHPRVGMLAFDFEGTVLTDPQDQRTIGGDLRCALQGETCDWLTQPVVGWFEETVRRAVLAEFDRYIAAGDLEKTVQRIQQLQAKTDNHGGFLGMGL